MFVFHVPVVFVIIIILCMVTAIMGTPTWRERCAPDCHLSALRLHWHRAEHAGQPFMGDGAVKAASKSQVHSLGLAELMKDEAALLSAQPEVGTSERGRR